MKSWHLIGAVLLLVLALAGYRLWNADIDPPVPIEPETYATVLSELEAGKAAWSEKMRERTGTALNATLDSARQSFIDAVAIRLAALWMGTPWDYNGVSELPRQGHIACGYFVTTLLRDAGVSLDRSGLARMPSEQLIKSLTTEKYITRHSNQSIGSFCESVLDAGPGLYILGLDNHVGFILHDSRELWFIHSHPPRALRERLDKSRVVIRSRYRVTGKISDDDRFIQKWLETS